MFKITLGKVDELQKKIWILEKEKEQMQKDFELKVDLKLSELKTKMQKELIESDLLRTQAIAKLEVLEKIDTKSDANEIKKLLHEMVSLMANNNKQMPITINKIV